MSQVLLILRYQVNVCLVLQGEGRGLLRDAISYFSAIARQGVLGVIIRFSNSTRARRIRRTLSFAGGLLTTLIRGRVVNGNDNDNQYRSKEAPTSFVRMANNNVYTYFLLHKIRNYFNNGRVCLKGASCLSVSNYVNYLTIAYRDNATRVLMTNSLTFGLVIRPMFVIIRSSPARVHLIFARAIRRVVTNGVPTRNVLRLSMTRRMGTREEDSRI